MLSIRFDKDHEWWIPGRVFERLFSSALEHGQLTPSLAEWRHVVTAISFSDDEQGVARELMAGLRAAAIAELARLPSPDVTMGRVATAPSRGRPYKPWK